MTLRSYLIIMSLATLFCWLAWGIVIFMVDPEQTNWIGLVLFYASLFLSVSGTSALAGFLIRFVAMKKQMVWRLVKEAFRQSLLISVLLIVSLMLISYNLFTWLNLFFLVLGLSILEFFLISYEKPSS